MDTESVNDFEQALTTKMGEYGLELPASTIRELGRYYALLSRWNPRLHLVAPCGPEEFANRHVLESLVLLRLVSTESSLIDVGPGGGLPSIPCLIARPDLTATLVESSKKKSVFLQEALNQLGLTKQGKVVASSFEDIDSLEAQFITCRALDDFMSKVSRLVSWAPTNCKLLLFGGEALRHELEKLDVSIIEYLIPLSQQRFLFEVKKN